MAKDNALVELVKNLLFGIMLNTLWWKMNTFIFQGEKWTTKVVIKKACKWLILIKTAC